MVARIKKIIKQTRLKPKAVKQTSAVNPYERVLPKRQAMAKHKKRPLRQSIRGKQPLTKKEFSNRPLRNAKYHYGGRGR